jgi:hypothetical protein
VEYGPQLQLCSIFKNKGNDLELSREENIVEYATLGNTGLLVSKLCVGTMTFGDCFEQVCYRLGDRPAGGLAKPAALCAFAAKTSLLLPSNADDHGPTKYRYGNNPKWLKRQL